MKTAFPLRRKPEGREKSKNEVDTVLKKWMCIFMSAAIMVGLFSACKTSEEVSAAQNLIEASSAMDMDISGDRAVTKAARADKDRHVGVFYFLWMGVVSAEGPYDVSKIKENDPNAAASNEAWLAAGGGEVGDYHWWGESLFGYYRSSDVWVMERDVQMLTDAGVDFLALDYSNAVDYSDQLILLTQVLDKYYQQGYDVPKITFITKASSGSMVMNLYKRYYQVYPEYSHLWYEMDGKPLMVGISDDAKITEECRAFFTWRHPQWPRETYRDDGFPWMDFTYPQNVYGNETGTTIMSVSVAQHSGTLAMSSSALYGDNTNHTRNWHDGANDTSPDAYLYGYNFSEQFENAIAQDPDMIFVTGWNEWIAARQESWDDKNGNPITDPVILVDNCDINNSRDIQPMKGGYGDNYYMLLVDYIRQYKGTGGANLQAQAAKGGNGTTKVYYDYTEDTDDRNAKGFGSLVYTDTTGRNDIYQMKMANDERYLYAYAQTKDTIVGMGSDHCMTLFLNTGKGNTAWCGYDFVIGRTAATETTVSVEQRTASGWTKIGDAEYILQGNEMQIMIPAKLLGLDDGNELNVEFKWADNYQGEDDLYSFYLNGDAAPYGRLNYTYTAPGFLADYDHVYLDEVTVNGAPVTDHRPVVRAGISANTILGTWTNNRDGSGSVGPQLSYDGSVSTMWNPQVKDYVSGEGIIYTLDERYDISAAKLTFGSRKYYFTLSVSHDGVSYTELFSVNSSNSNVYYDGYVCTLPDLTAYGVKYVKIEFTGSGDGGKWIALYDVEITGKACP